MPLALLLLGSCSSPTGATEWTALAAAEARWESERPANYAFELRRSCFCPPEYVQWHRVEVHGEAITGLTNVETGAPVPADRWGEWATVDGLFAQIRGFLTSAVFGRIEGDYHPDLGFPTSIDLIAREGVADAGMTITIRSFGALP
jgi:hypothetical protein